MAAAGQHGECVGHDSLRLIYSDVARGQLSSKPQRALRFGCQCQRMVLGLLRSGTTDENIARRLVVSVNAGSPLVLSPTRLCFKRPQRQHRVSLCSRLANLCNFRFGWTAGFMSGPKLIELRRM